MLALPKSLLSCLSHAPLDLTDLTGKAGWIAAHVSRLAALNLGPDWVALVHEWVQFERRHGLAKRLQVVSTNNSAVLIMHADPIPKTAKTSTPTCIKHWVATSRSVRYKVRPEDQKDFAVSWSVWWAANQPKWRVKSGDVWPQTLDGSLTSLAVSGQKGFMEYIVFLGWWGEAAKSEVDRRDWKTAVNDATWVVKSAE